MPIRTNCPKCSNPLTVRDDNAGKLVRCPKCEATFTVARPNAVSKPPVKSPPAANPSPVPKALPPKTEAVTKPAPPKPAPPKPATPNAGSAKPNTAKPNTVTPGTATPGTASANTANPNTGAPAKSKAAQIQSEPKPTPPASPPPVPSRPRREQEDAPPRHSHGKEKSAANGLSMGWIIGIGAGAVAVVVLVALGTYFMLGDSTAPAPIAQNPADAPPQPANTKPAPNDPASVDAAPVDRPPSDPNQKNQKELTKESPKNEQPKEAPPKEAPPEPLPNQIGAKDRVRVKNATVYLRVTHRTGVSEGSGFFAMEPGLVVTNAHVLGLLTRNSSLPEAIDVVMYSGEPNEQTFKGKVIGVDRSNDLALIRVADLPKDAPEPLELSLQHEPYETQKVYIYGFPLGVQLGKNITVTESSISSLRKGETGVIEQVQVNGGMHPGNSGGPVVNSAGALVGVSVAVIKNTTINFAVPGPFVKLLFDGRIDSTRPGIPFVEKDRTLVLLETRCVDPIGRIQDMEVEVWEGRKGKTRPFSLRQPDALPGDGPRQSSKMTYRNAFGYGVIKLPKISEGNVAWVQPVIVTAGGNKQWGEAFAVDPKLAVQQKPALLQFKLHEKHEQTVHLKTSQSVSLSKGKNQVTFSDAVALSMLESFSANPKGAVIHTGFNRPQLTERENGHEHRVDGRVTDILARIPPVFVVDNTNQLRERSDINLNRNLAIALRERVGDFYTQICNAYEAGNLVIPNRSMQPTGNWTTRVPMLLKGDRGPELVDLHLVCVYEGLRVADNNQALITVTGKVVGRNARSKVGGRVNGTFVFHVDEGFIAAADLNIISEATYSGDLRVVYEFDIDIARVPGNPQQLALGRTSAQNDGALLARISSALTAVDPPDDRFLRSKKKEYTVKLQSGKTYTIHLESNAFDAFLRLHGPKRERLAENDDSGGTRNSRIQYRPTVTADYTIVVTSLGGRLGFFDLKVHGDKGEKVDLVASNSETPKKETPTTVLKGKGAIANPDPIQFHNDENVTLRYLTFGQQGGGPILGDIIWDRDGKSIFVLKSLGILQRIDIATGQTKNHVDIQHKCSNLALSGEGLLVSVLGANQVWVFDPQTLTTKKKISVPGLKHVKSGIDSSVAWATSPKLSAIDLKEGVVKKSYDNISTYHFGVTPNGKYLLNYNDQLTRFRINGFDLVLDQDGYFLGNSRQLCISPDSMFVAAPAGGGNGKHADHPPLKNYATFIYPVENLKQPVTGYAAGGYPAAVGIDTKSRCILAQNADNPLLIYSFSTDYRMGAYSFPRKSRESIGVREFSVSPFGFEAIVRLNIDTLVHVRINKAGPFIEDKGLPPDEKK